MSVSFVDNMLRGISQEITQPSVTKVILKITYPKFHLTSRGQWVNDQFIDFFPQEEKMEEDTEKQEVDEKEEERKKKEVG